MPESNENQKAAKTKPTWVEIGTLFVLAVTLVGVWWYACEAHRQNRLLKSSVDEQILSNRPVMFHNGVGSSEKTPDGTPTKVKIRWKNFGRSLAISVVSAGHIFARPKGEPAPIDRDCDANGPLPTMEERGAVAPGEYDDSEKGLAEGESVVDFDVRNQRLYVSGCLYYFGIGRQKRYFTDLCVFWTPKGQQEFKSCDDPKRNYAE